jgi:hypothetical protein
MELRWNNARPDAGPEGKKAKPNASHSVQGLEIKEPFSTSGRGIRMSLTSPLIDQANFTQNPLQRSAGDKAMFRQQSIAPPLFYCLENAQAVMRQPACVRFSAAAKVADSFTAFPCCVKV